MLTHWPTAEVEDSLEWQEDESPEYAEEDYPVGYLDDEQGELLHQHAALL